MYVFPFSLQNKSKKKPRLGKKWKGTEKKNRTDNQLTLGQTNQRNDGLKTLQLHIWFQWNC